MRTNLEPIIDTLFEEDELFAQDFDQDGLNRILFIRKMGIYVEVRFLQVSYSLPSSNPSYVQKCVVAKLFLVCSL